MKGYRVIAEERMQILFESALSDARNNPRMAQHNAMILRRISSKYRLPLPCHIRRSFCKKCRCLLFLVSVAEVRRQDKDQDYAYLVQIQDADGVTVLLSWITGTLPAGSASSPSQSWTPTAGGDYTATVFVWESITNPTALSPSDKVTIQVS